MRPEGAEIDEVDPDEGDENQVRARAAGDRHAEAHPIGVALTAYDLWKRLPPKQRKAILQQARRYGPRVIKAAARARRPK